MKKLIFIIPIFVLFEWSCKENSTITEVIQKPGAVTSSIVINGNSKATIAWVPTELNPPQRYVVYRDTVATFSFATAVPITSVNLYPLGGVVDSFLTNGKNYFYTVVGETKGSQGTIVRTLPENTVPAHPFDYTGIPTSSISYANHIQPIFSSGCAVPQCHVRSGVPSAMGKRLNDHRTGGQFSLLSWEDAVKGDGAIAVIVPFKSSKSDLIRHVNRDSTIAPASQPSMPRDDIALPRDQVDVLMRWIDNGAKNDNGDIPYSAIPPQGRVYITNQGEDLVAVVDVNANLVVRYVTAGVPDTKVQPPQAPHNVIVDPQNQYYYVNLVGGNKLLKFKISDDTKVGEVSTGITSPAQIALTAGGDTAYVTNFFGSSSSITMVNTRSMSVISPINDPRMKQPHGVTITPNNKYVLVMNYSSDNVTVIQTSDNTVLDVIRLSNSVPVFPTTAPQFQPYQSVVSLDSKLAYVSCALSNEVRVIDLIQMKVVDSIKVGVRPLVPDITPDGNFVYVANRNSNSVSVIRTADRTVVTTIQNVGIQPHGLAISRNGSYAYVSCENLDGTDDPHHPTAGGKKIGIVAIIDIATNTVIRQLEVGNFAAGVAVMH